MDDPTAVRAGPPLQPLGVGTTSREWIYPLTLTLEELFSGKHCHFGIVRRMNSGKERNVVIELDIPPGCQRGTRILCRGVGHELPDGSLQDIVFVVEEAAHDRFTRLGDDLSLDLRISWTDDLRRHPKRVGIRGLDGEELSIYIEYARDRVLTGSHGIRGAGMPIRRHGEVCGRGNLIVR
jgi:DnaJ-class molecular chaperone